MYKPIPPYTMFWLKIVSISQKKAWNFLMKVCACLICHSIVWIVLATYYNHGYNLLGLFDFHFTTSEMKRD